MCLSNHCSPSGFCWPGIVIAMGILGFWVHVSIMCCPYSCWLESAHNCRFQPSYTSMTICVTLQLFGGDSWASDVSVEPLMPLGELRRLAKKELLDPGRPGYMYIGTINIGLAVQHDRCMDMDENLSQCNIIDGTTVTIIQVNDEVPQTINAAENKLQLALRKIEAADKALGGDHPELQFAWRRLQECTHPLARGAADAHMHIHNIIDSRKRHRHSTAAALQSIKTAERDIRDLVVLLCQAVCIDPSDHHEFDRNVTRAYDDNLEPEMRGHFLMAYHKFSTTLCSTTVALTAAAVTVATAKNRMATDHRGGPRPRRRHDGD